MQTHGIIQLQPHIFHTRAVLFSFIWKKKNRFSDWARYLSNVFRIIMTSDVNWTFLRVPITLGVENSDTNRKKIFFFFLFIWMITLFQNFWIWKFVDINSRVIGAFEKFYLQSHWKEFVTYCMLWSFIFILIWMNIN